MRLVVFRRRIIYLCYVRKVFPGKAHGLCPPNAIFSNSQVFAYIRTKDYHELLNGERGGIPETPYRLPAG